MTVHWSDRLRNRLRQPRIYGSSSCTVDGFAAVGCGKLSRGAKHPTLLTGAGECVAPKLTAAGADGLWILGVLKQTFSTRLTAGCRTRVLAAAGCARGGPRRSLPASNPTVCGGRWPVTTPERLSRGRCSDLPLAKVGKPSRSVRFANRSAPSISRLRDRPPQPGQWERRNRPPEDLRSDALWQTGIFCV
jgi:hypothetical protein